MSPRSWSSGSDSSDAGFERAVGYEFGVTDEQLYQHIGMTVHPGNLFFAEMSATYPGGVG
ncbi:hypothetical protein [Corynebacterium sp.]|uniref:hypothetical protein n=1 Tax=Corynebacterium sp. TaxID=1720 RepID=UPI003B3A4882